DDLRPIGANHKLTREHVAIDETVAHHIDQRIAPESLEPVGIGASKTERDAQKLSVELTRQMACPRAIVFGALDELRTDDHLGGARLEQVDRAAVKLRVTKIDLVADDDLAARLEDAALERLSVVRLARRKEPDFGIFVGELFGNRDG